MATSYPEGTALNPNIGEEYTLEGGVAQTQIYEGEIIEIFNRYQLEKSLAAAYNDTRIANLRYEPMNGRARFIKAFMRENELIEELYAVEIQKDIALAPYFATLSDVQIVAVRTAFENKTAAVSGWDSKQKVLYTHLIHGAETYNEKAFDLRVNHFVSTNSIAAPVIDMSDIETVVSLPSLSTNMQKLVATLPSGEWLQGAMQAEHLGRGRWRLENILHWSKQWSVIYGGTLFAS